MPDRTRLTDKVTVGGQPTVDDLRALSAEGFVTVVDLRASDGPTLRHKTHSTGGCSSTTSGGCLEMASVGWTSVEPPPEDRELLARPTCPAY